MTNVSNLDLIHIDCIKDQIAQPRLDDDAGVRFVCLSSFEGIFSQSPRTFDDTGDDARGAIRAVLSNISLNLSEIALRGTGEPDPHVPSDTR